MCVTEVEFSSESVNAEHGEDVAGHGGRHGDERLEKNGAGDVVGARVQSLQGGGVHARHVKVGDAADGRRLAGVRFAELVEAVEQLGEPHHQPVVPF